MIIVQNRFLTSPLNQSYTASATPATAVWMLNCVRKGHRVGGPFKHRRNRNRREVATASERPVPPS